jgi:hypothetical protein
MIQLSFLPYRYIPLLEIDSFRDINNIDKLNMDEEVLGFCDQP